ncbi:BCL2/adenovirus E1B 19 kDa protein-interacting protein 3-like [Babylonia areolata]|uniref:BCL2/adenovirus E1B 19 kDa protein-interacting protein 3-like n=1 Tax=Babylonia areolata TaxID=304850 RepID=UPI003FD3A6AF
MASQKPLQEGELNDSWVELQMQQNLGLMAEPTIETPHQASAYNGNLEKLLIEAQRESRSTSYANSKESSARASPKSPPSPSSADWGSEGRTRLDPGSDWIWDWSSGPEIQQPGDWSGKFRHPGAKPRRIPAKVPVTKSGIFRLENLPTLLLTHACTFFLGAAVMFMYLKKYCHWTTVVSSALD